MKDTKAELLFHPIRIQIILTIASRQLTPLQLAELLPEVPQATLYRHLNKLAEGSILKVVDKRQVRGTVEKVYALNSPEGSTLGPEDVKNLSKDDHMRYFTTFIAGLLSQFAHYLQKDQVDLVADGVGYHQVPINLSDTEFMQMGTEMNKIIMQYLDQELTPERTRRIFTIITMPEAKQ